MLDQVQAVYLAIICFCLLHLRLCRGRHKGASRSGPGPQLPLTLPLLPQVTIQLLILLVIRDARGLDATRGGLPRWQLTQNIHMGSMC